MLIVTLAASDTDWMSYNGMFMNILNCSGNKAAKKFAVQFAGRKGKIIGLPGIKASCRTTWGQLMGHRKDKVQEA